METERLENGFYVSKGEDIKTKIVARQLLLSEIDSIENYDIVSEEEGLELIRQIEDSMNENVQTFTIVEVSNIKNINT